MASSKSDISLISVFLFTRCTSIGALNSIEFTFTPIAKSYIKLTRITTFTANVVVIINQWCFIVFLQSLLEFIRNNAEGKSTKTIIIKMIGAMSFFTLLKNFRIFVKHSSSPSQQGVLHHTKVTNG